MISQKKKINCFYESYVYYQYKFNKKYTDQTLYLINKEWFNKWKNFNYNNLEKYFEKNKIISQSDFNGVFNLVEKYIILKNEPGMIMNLDIIETFNSFLNDGNINDPFNLVVDSTKKKYYKIPQTLWHLLSENYGEDYKLPSFYSEQTPYEIFFYDENKHCLLEGKIYLNSNNKDIRKRIVKISQADRLNGINNNIKIQDIKIEFKQELYKNKYIKVYINGAKKKIQNEYQSLMDSKNSEELSKLMSYSNKKEDTSSSNYSNSNKDSQNIQVKNNYYNNIASLNNNKNELENSKKNIVKLKKRIFKSTSQNNVIIKKNVPNEIEKKSQFLPLNINPNLIPFQRPSYIKQFIVPKKIREQKNINNDINHLNLGQFSYMNSVLQILSNIKSLKDYFLNKHYEREININSSSKGEIAKAFYDVLNEIWNKNNSNIEILSYNLNKTIMKYNQLYDNNINKDPLIFLINLLGYLSDDLSQAEKLDKPLDEYEKEPNVRWKLYKRINKSKIFDLFYGMIKNEKNCLNIDCKHSQFGFDIFNVSYLFLNESEFTLNKKFLNNNIIIVNCYIVLYPFNNFNKCVCIQYPIEENSYENIIINQIIDFVKKITKIKSFNVRFDDLINNKNEIIELSGNEFLIKKKNKNEKIDIFFYQNKIEKSNFKKSEDLYNYLIKERENIFNFYYVEKLKRKKKLVNIINKNNNDNNKEKNDFSEFLLSNFKISNSQIERIGTQQLFHFNENETLNDLYLSICSTFKNLLDEKQVSMFKSEMIPYENFNQSTQNYIIEDYNKIKWPFLISYRLQDYYQGKYDKNILIPNNDITFNTFLRKIKEIDPCMKQFASLNLDIFWIEKNNKMIDQLNNLSNMNIIVFNFFEGYRNNQIKLNQFSNYLCLKDLINFYQSKEILLNENIVCEQCEQLVYIKTTYLEIPKVFIFQLSRIKNGKVNKTFVDFDLTFNSKNYFPNLMKNEKYELIGIIYYYNSSLNDNHYYSAYKNSFSGRWIKYNNNQIIHINEDELKNENVYALIYQQNNLNI